MSSTFTPAKNLEQPSNNSYIGTWDQPVNSNWGIIDSCFGGITSVTVTGSGASVTLSTEQIQCFAIDITGTLTQAFTLSFPAGVPGYFVIINNTTGGYSITADVFGSAGSTIVIPQGVASFIYTDGTNVNAPNALFAGLTGVASPLTGIGTSATPLAINQTQEAAALVSNGGLNNNVAVTSDASTIGGTGKSASALHVIPAGLASQVSVSTDGVTITGNGTSASPLAGGHAQAWWYQTSSLSGGTHVGFASISNSGYDGSVFTFTTPQADTNYVVMITPLAPYACGVSAQGTNSFTISQIGGTTARVAIAVAVFR